MIATAPDRPEVAARRLHSVALAGICLLAAVLHFWGIGESWGNSYYTAAVKSMSQSFENFFFGSFDAAGVITVDKPPMALWVQVLSVLAFGYNEVAVLLPQALAGVAGVFLLHRTVSRWAGEHAALVAALVMALTPITVAIDRDNNPDTLLVLLLIGAAHALTRAIQAERDRTATWWLVASGLLVGCGFLTKMLQAWMVLPVFAVAYLVGREAGWGRRVADLGAAGAAVLVGSFWWVAATMLWPSPKPYIGGSEDGSALDLVFGYNGFGRILGGSGQGPGGGPGGGGGFSGESGILRFANEQLAGQISWLMPLCALILVAVAVTAVINRRTGATGHRARAAGWVLWGGWLVLVWLMLSFAQGTMHPYYTTMLAPAIGAVTGAGLMWFWKRHPSTLLPLGVVITVVWAVVLVYRNPDWNVWAAWLAIGLGAPAVIALLLKRAYGRVALALSLAAILAVPGVWSVATAFGGQTGMGGANPTAGPTQELGGPRDDGPPGPRDAGAPPRRGGGMPGQGSLGDQQESVLDHVARNAGDRALPLLVEGGAMGASTYIINSDLPVVGMGGFTGSDDAPSVQQLAEWKRTGQLGFVQLGNAGPDQHAPGRARGGPMGGVATERQTWVKNNCAEVDPASYGGGAEEQDAGPMGGAGPLYDCRG